MMKIEEIIKEQERVFKIANHVLSDQEILDLADKKLFIKKICTIKHDNGRIREYIGLVNKIGETVRDFGVIERKD